MCFQINHSRNEIEFVQDMTHVGTKLRNRLLNCHIEMIMGTSKVSVAHLKDVVKNVHKSVHGLTMSDVNPTDRQNFRSFQKIVDERVLESLQQNVRGSEATIQYLKLCSNVTSSFLDYELTPVDRIYRMYQAVYFPRIWRNHIKRSRFHTLGQNSQILFTSELSKYSNTGAAWIKYVPSQLTTKHVVKLDRHNHIVRSH